ncbi:MAG: histidine--tRNA ligase [Bacilli bacterium]|nr:histidine--tRNA ligase [Bacilli bacterium]
MIQKPKGTYDVTKEQSETILYIEKLLKTVMDNYNYNYIRTPLFEASELFHRGVGETTDIVTKETYDFKDRGDRNMTLRPEGTAGVVRAFLENKMYADPDMPSKNWYYGPMYRYERPQKGRYRELYQFGVEVFGSSDPMMDAEVISIPVSIYKLLGLKGVKVKINSLGDKESREAYRNALLAYFKPHLDDLCDDCRERYQKNPLRILDCKVDADKDYMKKAPTTIEYLNEESKTFFENVQKYLDALGIDYEVDPSVVRGLDYYTHTVFEIEASIEGFGSQNVLCGGGRYDGLVEVIGDKKVPGVGFALGMERLLSALEFEKISLVEEKSLDVYVIPVGEEDKEEAFFYTQTLRMNGFTAETDYMNRNLKANFKQADRLNAKFLLILGEEERKAGIYTLKDNREKKEYKIDKEEIVDFLDTQIMEEEHE